MKVLNYIIAIIILGINVAGMTIAISQEFSNDDPTPTMGYDTDTKTTVNDSAYNVIKTSNHVSSERLSISGSSYTEEDKRCLSLNIYFEARNQNPRGQVAVASVTMNRIKSSRYPNTICGVVKQAKIASTNFPIKHKCQFSWYCDGDPDKPNLSNPIERRAWNLAQDIAHGVLTGAIRDNTDGALHYHAKSVDPYWSKSLNKLVKVGDHIFYSG